MRGEQRAASGVFGQVTFQRNAGPRLRAVLAAPLACAIAACVPNEDAPPPSKVTEIRSALTSGVAPIAVGGDTRIRVYALPSQFRSIPEGHLPHTLALGDLDADGLDEIIVGAAGFFGAFTQSGAAVALPTPPFNFSFLPGDGIASGDFDGNGRDEIVVGSQTGTIGGGVFLYSTDPTINTAGSLPSNVLFPPGSEVAVCDLDNDGRDEIVVAHGITSGDVTPTFRI